ncbi:MAG: DUF222 domain-containing protein [Aeromicrobium sp.]
MDSGVTIERLRDAAWALKSGDSRTRLRAIQAAQDALDAAKAKALVELETSKDYELDGASTVTTWARNELRLDAGGVKKLIRAAVTVRDLPAVADAAAAGRIRLDHLAVFSYGLKHIGHRVVTESEGWLLDVAVAHEPGELRRVMRSLREAVYPDSLDEAWAAGMDREDFQVNPVPDGWHVNGFLNTVTGAKLKSVLDSLGAPRDGDDTRPGADRRVTALDTLLTTVLESGLPSDQGIRPHLSVIVDTNGPTAQLAAFGAIGPRLLELIGCNADLTPIVTDGTPEQARVLNVGRTHRLATVKQRRAIIARQGGICATPGCHNTHLEIHHTTAWSDGGRTDLDHLIGLCVRCHHLVHRDLLHVTADGTGAFAFTTRHHRPLEREHRPHVPPRPRPTQRRIPLRT